MHELTEDGLFDGPKLLRRLLLKYLFGFGVAKRLNHELIVYRYSVNCKANDSGERFKPQQVGTHRQTPRESASRKLGGHPPATPQDLERPIAIANPTRNRSTGPPALNLTPRVGRERIPRPSHEIPKTVKHPGIREASAPSRSRLGLGPFQNRHEPVLCGRCVRGQGDLVGPDDLRPG